MTDTTQTLHANLTALQQCNPAVHDWLAPLNTDCIQNNLFTNPAGHADWRLPNGQGMFGALPPGMFYGDWLPTPPAQALACVLVGCNVGYGVVHVLKNSPANTTVLLLEPRPELLLGMLALTDFTRPILDRRLRILKPEPEHVRATLHTLDLYFLFGQVVLHVDTPSRQLGSEYSRWHHHLSTWIDSYSEEMQTLYHFQDTMIGNELHNFHRAQRDGTVRNVHHAARKTGALILGAGPSLEQTARILAENPPQILMIAALQTLPALQLIGLKPHLCMVTDPTPDMRLIFNRLDPDYARDIPLIYATETDPEVLTAYPGPTKALWTKGGLGSIIFQNQEFVLDVGSNVALGMFRFLVWCGVEHIVLAGQDFGWQGEKNHAQGHHAAEHPILTTSTFFRTAHNKDGAEVNTSCQFLRARNDLEHEIASAKISVFNIQDGGLDIAGTTVRSAVQIREQGLLHAPENVVAQFLATLNTPVPSAPLMVLEAQAAQWQTSLTNVGKRLETLFAAPDTNNTEIRQSLMQTEFFLRHNPLYMPYLFKEITQIAWMARLQLVFEQQDMDRVASILSTAARKVLVVDNALAAPAHTSGIV